MRKKRFNHGLILILIFIIQIVINSNYVFSENIKSNKKVIIFVVNRISIEDLQNSSLKNIRAIFDKGAFAIMNTNTQKTKNDINSFATMNSGAKALGSSFSDNIYTYNEIIGGQIAKNIYKRSTGYNPLKYEILFPYINQIKQTNKDTKVNTKIGAVGDELHNNDLKTAVIGNSDQTDDGTKDLNIATSKYQPHREFAQFLMDSKGTVDFGDLSTDLLIKNKNYPMGIMTNNDKMFENFKKVYNKSNVIEVSFGDLDRLEASRNYTTQFRYNLYKNNILRNSDKLIGKIFDYSNTGNTEFMIVTPTPAIQKLKTGEVMTPVAVYDKQLKKGLLSSPTTHRVGIITNNDVSYQILSYFGIPEQLWFSGQPLNLSDSYKGSKSFDARYSYLTDMYSKIIFNSNQRLPILVVFAYYIIIALGLGIINACITHKKRKVNKKFFKVAESMLLSIIFIPVSIFLLPIFKPIHLWQSYIYIAIMTFLMTFVIIKYAKNPLDVFIIGGAASTVILLADLFTGSYLVQNCPLGYDPQIGARYYGLGNEVMGVLLGASILFTTLLMDRLNRGLKYIKIMTVALYAFIVFVLTYPGLGTKAGGAITAVAAFAVVLFKVFKKKVGLKQFLLIVGGIFSILLLLILADALHKGGSQSHIGRAAMAIKQGGLIQAWYIIERKVAMNIMLMKHSYWSLVLIVSLIVLALMYKWKVKFLNKMFAKYPYAYIGFLGTIVSSLVALVFNDSGIVAAATNSIYPISLLIYLEAKLENEILINKIKC